MSAFDLLQRWLQPLLDPLNEVRGVIQQPLSIHQEAVSTFASLVAGLYEGSDSFQGDTADAVKATTESYLHVEAQFSGAGSAATGTFAAAAVLTIPTATTDTVLEGAADTSVECAVEITGAMTTAATEMGAEAGLDAVTEVVDVAAVAQAGLDPVTDIPAGILTAIDLGAKIVFLVALGWSIFQAVQRWIGEMNRLGHITWPPLPSFMDPYGSSSGFTNQGGGLTPQETKIAEELFKEFGNSGITLDEISAIIANNPGLSKDQYRLLIEYYRRYQKMPYGVVSVIGVGTNKKGKSAKIFYVTQGDVKHVRGGHIEFDTLTDDELVALLGELLLQQPDAIKSTKDSDKYEYDDVEIDGKYYTIGIAVSKNNLGRIVTTFVTRDQ